MPTFFALTLLTNGPLAVFLPTAFEPVLMVYARLYSPWQLATVGTGGAALAEVLNYRLFGAALDTRMMGKFRASRLAARLSGWFGRRPFLTVLTSAFLPIPFWITRIAGSLARYPAGRFIAATALGRFPRFALFSLLVAAAPVSDRLMYAAAAVVTLLFLVPLLRR